MGLWVGDVNLDIDIGFGSGPLATSPSWTDVSTDVRALTITRGRSSVHDQFDSGTMVVTVDNRDGDFDPNNTSSPHDPDLKLGTPLRIQATHSVTTYDLGRGHISRWPLDYSVSPKFEATVALEVTENLAILRTTRLQAQAEVFESVDTRIGNILDAVSWPAADRSLTSTATGVAAVTFTGSAGIFLDQAVEAEQGYFFIAKNGDATFRPRTLFSSTSSQATFGSGGGELDYTAIDILPYDDDLLINLAEITGATGNAQSKIDTTSRTAHGEHAFSSSNASIPNESSAQNVADWIVGKHKDVEVRITGFTIQPQNDPTNLWPEVLDRELLDLVTIKFDPPGGGDALNQLVAIEGIQHSIGPGFWETTYTCHPASAFETTSYWDLDTSQLDTTTVLA